jgi:hypothetical protein
MAALHECGQQVRDSFDDLQVQVCCCQRCAPCLIASMRTAFLCCGVYMLVCVCVCERERKRASVCVCARARAR